MVFNAVNKEIFSAWAARPKGSLLICGPPQSGLTTSLDFIVSLIYKEPASDQVWDLKQHWQAAGGKISQIELVRQLISRISQIRAQTNKPRLIVVDDLDLVSSQAQNVLLKTLEEPPWGSHFIMATSKPESVLPTVISRCQVVNLRRPPKKELLALFVNQTKEELERAYLVSEGWPGALTNYLGGQKNALYYEIKWGKEFLGLTQSERPIYIFGNKSAINLAPPIKELGERFGQTGESAQLRANLTILLNGLVRLSRATMRAAVERGDGERTGFWRRWLLETSNLQKQLEDGLNPKTVALALSVLQ